MFGRPVSGMPARKPPRTLRTQREWERLAGWSGKEHLLGKRLILPKKLEVNAEYEQRVKGLGRRLKGLVGGFTVKELSAASVGDLLRRIHAKEAKDFGKSNEWPKILKAIESSKEFVQASQPHTMFFGLDGDLVVFTGAGGKRTLDDMSELLGAAAANVGAKRVLYWGDAKEALPQILTHFGTRAIQAYAEERRLSFDQRLAIGTARRLATYYASPGIKFTQYDFVQGVLGSYFEQLRAAKRSRRSR